MPIAKIYNLIIYILYLINYSIPYLINCIIFDKLCAMSTRYRYNTRSSSSGIKRSYLEYATTNSDNIPPPYKKKSESHTIFNLKSEINCLYSYLQKYSDNITTLNNKISDIVKMIKIYITCKHIISQEKIKRDLELLTPDGYSHLKILWSINKPFTLNIVYDIDTIELNSLTIKTMPNDQFIKICNSYPLIYTLLNNLYKYLFNLHQKNICSHNKITLLLNNKQSELKFISLDEGLSDDTSSHDTSLDDISSHDTSLHDMEEKILLDDASLDDTSLDNASLDDMEEKILLDNILSEEDILQEILSENTLFPYSDIFSHNIILHNRTSEVIILDNVIQKECKYITETI